MKVYGVWPYSGEDYLISIHQSREGLTGTRKILVTGFGNRAWWGLRSTWLSMRCTLDIDP